MQKFCLSFKTLPHNRMIFLFLFFLFYFILTSVFLVFFLFLFFNLLTSCSPALPYLVQFCFPCGVKAPDQGYSLPPNVTLSAWHQNHPRNSVAFVISVNNENFYVICVYDDHLGVCFSPKNFALYYYFSLPFRFSFKPFI